MPRGNGGIIGPVNTSFSGVWSLTEAQLRRSANTWPNFYAALLSESATGSDVFSGADAADPYFEYTTLLLPGNGTNGAQNNTFLDSSSNTFTVTRNPATGPNAPTQGTFSPFSQTGWGNYFPGASSYVTFPYSSGLVFGTNDFCVEFWMYWIGGANENNLLMNNASGGFNIRLVASTSTNWSLENSYVGQVADFGTAPTKNVWHHIAITRNSGTLRAFIDGVQVYSGANSTNFTNTATWYLGANGYSVSTYYVNAYVSNLRIVVGSPVYTSAFTPPTSPLTAITNTQLLTCQSNRFIDTNTQTTAKTITVSGSPSVQAFSPFNPTASWSAATYGGSGYFDGSGDYLSSSGGTAIAMGTGDFTWELFAYIPAATGYQGFIETRSNPSAGSTDGFGFLLNTGTLTPVVNTSSNVLTSSVNIVANAWNHIALTRSGTTLTVWVNGASGGSTTNSTNLTNQSFSIGGFSVSPNAYLTGYLANIRITKGGVLYTTAFTPPTSPLTTTVSSGTVSLLLNFTNAGIYDATSKNDLETVGDAKISTAQSKWGGSSMAFDGTGDYLLLPPNPPNNLTPLGTGDFTVEFWVRFTSFYNYITLIASTRGANGFNAGSNASAQIVWYANGAERVRGTTAMSANTWYHIAFVRYSGVLKGYLNGTQDGTTYTDSINYSTPIIRVADLDSGGEVFTGYLQDLRITKGYARYTSNFTPPTAAFPTL